MSSILRNACVKEKDIPFFNTKATIVKMKGIFLNKKGRDVLLELAEKGDVEFVLTFLSAMELVFKVKKISIYERYLKINGENGEFDFETNDLRVEREDIGSGQIIKMKENEIVDVDEEGILLIQVLSGEEGLKRFVEEHINSIIFLEGKDEELKELKVFPIEKVKQDIWIEFIMQILGDDIFSKANKQEILNEITKRNKWTLKKLKFFLLDTYTFDDEQMVETKEVYEMNGSKNVLSSILKKIKKNIEKILDQ